MAFFSSSRVPGEADHLHPVEERGLDGVEDVRRGDEEDARQVVRHREVVVAEREVLFRIQDLEERGGRVAPVVGADLVDLVQHEHRVRRPGLMDALDDPAGHGADVGAAVAPDLGLVPHAPQREPHELAVEGAGDRAAQRRLAHARRPDETEDRALQALLQGVDREELEDALLDLLDVVVVLVQDLARAVDVLGVLGNVAPGKAGHPVEVRADDRRLGGVGMAALEPLDLLFDLGRGLLGDLLVDDHLAERVELFGDLLAFAELLLDRPELLAEVVLPLRLVHLAAGLRRDLLLHRQDGDLFGEVVVDEPQALDRIGRFQDLLRLLELQVEVGRGEVRQARRVVEVPGDDHHFRRDALAQRDRLLQVLLDAPQQGLVLGRELVAGARSLRGA